MRKLTLVLVSLMLCFSSVYAECTEYEKSYLRDKIDDISYSLSYNSEYMDMNGDFQDGYFKIKLDKKYDDYYIYVNDGDYGTYIDDVEYANVTGGIYALNVYHSSCDEIIKTYQISIPYYRQYCNINTNCDDDVWFDGTYEYKDDNKDETVVKKILGSKVVIVLIALITIIIILYVFMRIRKKKKIKGISVLLIFGLLAITNVDAVNITGTEVYVNKGSAENDQSKCSYDNAYYNSTVFYETSGPYSSQSLIYDIAYVDIQNNVFTIYGWAFINGVDNTLGKDTFVDMVLALPSENKDVAHAREDRRFNVKYASESDSVEYGYGLNYYDLTYWNCWRTGNGTVKDKNGNLSGGMCIEYSHTDSFGTIHKSSPRLLGGFSASINISDIPKDYEFMVYMKVRSENVKDPKNDNNNKWVSLAAGLNAKSPNLADYATANKDGISINVGGFGETAKVIVGSGRLMGENGLYCSSKVPTFKYRSSTYFTKNIAYNIDGKSAIFACRGDCSSNKYKIRLYPVKVKLIENTSVKKGDTIVYAPATWIQVSGSIKIKKQAKEEVVVPKKCPDEVNRANCYEQNGTKVKFHESDLLNTCTIEKNNNSGFTLVEKNETVGYTGGPTFCEVACKDDIDMELPTGKYAVAGTYFELNEYVRKIKATRTCVTTRISYSDFDEELKKQEEDLVKKYNAWQDWIEINGSASIASPSQDKSKIKTESSTGSCCKWSKCPANSEDCSPSCLADTHYYSWSINSSFGTNYSETKVKYGGKSKTYSSCGSSSTLANKIISESKSEYNTNIYNEMIRAENAYKNALIKYQNTINNYNKCFNWVDTTSNVSVKSKNNTHTLEDVNSSEDYKVNNVYKFKPTVTFEYEEKEKGTNDYPTTYTYDYIKDVEYTDKNGNLKAYDTKITPITTKTYWETNGRAIDDYYETGTRRTSSYSTVRSVLNCSGTTCKLSDTKKKTFASSSYVLRTETYEFSYHLPIYSTTLPNGKIIQEGNYNTFKKTSYNESNRLLLKNEAVPININTERGTHNYSISVSNLVYKESTKNNSDIRAQKKMENKNLDDKFEDRFKTSLVLSRSNGDKYVCDYEVENDLYDPTTKDYMYFYRPIDLTSMDPNDRAYYNNIGYNWDYLSSTKEGNKAQRVKTRMESTGADYQELTKTDKFEFTLTPGAMQTIRAYNKNNVYGDFNMTCTNTNDRNYHCESKFLDCISNSNALYRNSCYNGIDSINAIDYQLLKNNRESLKDKLDDIIGW